VLPSWTEENDGMVILELFVPAFVVNEDSKPLPIVPGALTIEIAV
jgi:hypothetical protein